MLVWYIQSSAVSGGAHFSGHFNRVHLLFTEVHISADISTQPTCCFRRFTFQWTFQHSTFAVSVVHFTGHSNTAHLLFQEVPISLDISTQLICCFRSCTFHWTFQHSPFAVSGVAHFCGHFNRAHLLCQSCTFQRAFQCSTLAASGGAHFRCYSNISSPANGMVTQDHSLLNIEGCPWFRTRRLIYEPSDRYKIVGYFFRLSCTS